MRFLTKRNALLALQMLTVRAIRKANALRLEQMLHAGQFRSLADIRMTYGIPRMVLAKTLDMLDHTPEEIAAILRETY